MPDHRYHDFIDDIDVLVDECNKENSCTRQVRIRHDPHSGERRIRICRVQTFSVLHVLQVVLFLLYAHITTISRTSRHFLLHFSIFQTNWTRHEIFSFILLSFHGQGLQNVTFCAEVSFKCKWAQIDSNMRVTFFSYSHSNSIY